MRTKIYSHPEPNYSQISNIDLARMAAYIDSEGSIGINKRLLKSTNNWQYSIRVNVTNTNKELIDWIQYRFGGYVWSQQEKGRKGRRIYRWAVACKKAAKILELVLPYLICKPEQAANVLSLQKLIDHRRVTSEVNEQREKFYQKSLELNRFNPFSLVAEGSKEVQ